MYKSILKLMHKSFKINGQPNRTSQSCTSQSNILNPPILSTLLLILFSVALSACGGGGGGSSDRSPPGSNGDEIKSSSYAITNLRAIPGITNMTLTWDNPSANISMINISYIPTTGSNLTTELLTAYQGNSVIVSNQKNVTAAVTELTDGTQYNFTVSAILGGADAAKNTAGVNVNRTIGANFDNDDEPDIIDADDDNDGVIDTEDDLPKNSAETTDSDMDGTGDNADAFPMDNSRSAFTVGNLRAIPDVASITLTWDNPAANISMISVSYIATSGSANRVTQTLTTYQGNSIIGNNQTAASAAISPLTDGTEYNFTVTPILGGEDAAKNIAGVSAIRTIGANFDNDDEPDIIDADDDNDGADDDADAFPKNSAETTDTDGDGTGNNADTDDDGDGVNDINDAFPLDNSRSAFTVGNLRAIPGVTNITLTWDNPAASIGMINISYIPIAGGTLMTELLTEYQDNSIIGNNQAAASAVISALTDGTKYNFTVTPILGGEDAVKNTAGVSAIRTIGANFDNDDEPDSIDADDDGDGVVDIDSDMDGTGDNVDTNDDDDNYLDTADVDDDGDGLIEIHNATQLDQVRYNLAGTSFNGDNTGCGGLNSITTCSGYELAAPIDLTAIDNWQPLGFCRDDGCTNANREDFTGTFDGNGHIINGLTINSTVTVTTEFTVALFGAIEGADLRNIHLRNASVNINHAARTAMLVGNMRLPSTLSNSSAQGLVVSAGITGGLIGSAGLNNAISSSYVFDSVVMGSGDSVGGLAGSAGSNISTSYVSNTTVSGASNVGGLAGFSENGDISASYVIDSSINSSGDGVGGLIGELVSAAISTSYVSNTSVSGADFVGGLVGHPIAIFSRNSKVTASYVLDTSVVGSNYVGGLVGNPATDSPSTITINATYVAQVEVRATDSNIGGLAGNDPDGLKIAASYWQGAIFINGTQAASVVAGTNQTRSQLQISTFEGNYENWGGFWCDPDSGEFTSDINSPLAREDARDANRAWVLPPQEVSSSFPAAPHISRYPTLSCTPGGAAAQDAQRLGL